MECRSSNECRCGVPDSHRVLAESMYDSRKVKDRLMVRRAAYREIAIHQEGEGRSVYLSRLGAVQMALKLLREAVKQ